jgi:hypothetical protein
MSLSLRPALLVIDDPWEQVKTFFAMDGSIKYDSYIASGVSPTNRIIEDDVTAINTSMSARSPHKDWARLIERGDLPELEAVDPSWDLIALSHREWTDGQVPERLERLFTAFVGHGVGISRATKVLHIKRPSLVSVCDSYVLRLLGIPGDSTASGVAAMVHLREEGRRNLETLTDLRDRLEKEFGISRSLVRILDVLIWGSYPDTWLAKRAAARPPGGPAPE